MIINTLKTPDSTFIIFKYPGPYRAVNTISVTKTGQLMLYREIIDVCSQIHTKHTNTLCGRNVELWNVKLGGTCSNHWALKG